MSQLYGIKAIMDADQSHILGMNSARATAGDLLLDIWNGNTAAARVAGIEKDGEVAHGDGAVGRPGLHPLSDPDSGFYRVGADNLGMALGGVQKADYASSLIKFLTALRTTGALTADGVTTLEKEIVGKEIATPTTPATGYNKLYFKSDGRPYILNDGGTESELIADALTPLMFGDGQDGDVTLSSNTTLTEDKYYNSLTINSGVVLDTNGYRVFVKGTLDNNGTIRNNGSNGSKGQNASNGDCSIGGGNGGAGASGGTLAAGIAGGKGGQGDGSNNTEDPAENGASVDPSLGVNGVAGGAGGNGDYTTGKSPGSGGTATAEGLQLIPLSSLISTAGAEVLAEYVSDAQGAQSGVTLSPSAGAGGGGGGGHGVNSNCNGPGGGGGGGGGSGGIVLIVAKNLDNGGGVIEANGGNGGNGGNGTTYNTSDDSGGGGGGGGGAGGVVVLIYKTLVSGTERAAGGSGGSGGSANGSGQPGNAGTAGNPGNVYRIAA